MLTYTVGWDIELDANSPEDAARQALAIQRDINPTATCFAVTEDTAPLSPGNESHEEFAPTVSRLTRVVQPTPAISASNE